MSELNFAERLLAWYDLAGRKHLPWQQNPTPYRVWVSEIMLQQTQVATVIGYYQAFMQRFPDLFSLAAAPQEEVLHRWAGLGYYTRARNLHLCAQTLVRDHQGRFPLHDQQAMEKLPGIGPSTAAAIIALSSNQRAVILDGNVKRVLARYLALEGWPGKTAINRIFWQKADELTPEQRPAAYTQAIMDLGATLCTPRNPQCSHCPVAERCQALALGLTDQLPTPKPRKQLPSQERYFLLLRNAQDQLLLEQRPQQGIWGGLWSLPEFDTLENLQSWLLKAYPEAQLQTQHPDPIKHTFSHYHLLIKPQVACLPAEATGINEPPAEYSAVCWYNPRQPANLGLPAPIKKLLKGTPT